MWSNPNHACCTIGFRSSCSQPEIKHKYHIKQDSKVICHIKHDWFKEGYKIIRFLDFKTMPGKHHVLSNDLGNLIQKTLSSICFLIPSYYVNGQSKSICHIFKYDVFTFVAFVESGNEIESQA